MSEVQLWTPPGRVLQGHPLVGSSTGYQGKVLEDKAGNPRQEYFFSIAVPKNDPGMLQFWQVAQQVAAAGFPGGQSKNQDFAWKIKDGDNPKYAGKEGFAGMYVIGCTTGFAVKCCKDNGNTPITDPAHIKTGYYARAYVTLRPNGDLNKPGIYINPVVFDLVGYGGEIQSGPDLGQIMAEAPAVTLPAGASATPVAGSSAPPDLGAQGGPGGPPDLGTQGGTGGPPDLAAQNSAAGPPAGGITPPRIS